MYFTSDGVFRDRIEQLLRDLDSDTRTETEPTFRLRRFDLRQARQKLRQTVFQSEVFAVTGRVLPNQIDLADALAENRRVASETTDSNRRLRNLPRYCGITQNVHG